MFARTASRSASLIESSSGPVTTVPSPSRSSSAATPAAVLGWSPVIMTTSMPARRKSAIAAAAVGRAWVTQPEQAHQGEVLHMAVVEALVGDRSLGNHQHSQPAARQALHLPLDLGARVFVEPGLPVARRSLHATRQNALGRPFDAHPQCIRGIGGAGGRVVAACRHERQFRGGVSSLERHRRP